MSIHDSAINFFFNFRFIAKIANNGLNGKFSVERIPTRHGILM